MFSQDGNLSSLSQSRAGADSRWAIVIAGDTTPSPDLAGSHAVGGTFQLRYHQREHADLLLHLTLRRLQLLSPPRRTIAVSARDGATECGDLVHHLGGQRICEPAHRGTASSILMAASYVMEFDPRATLLIYPPHHAAFPEDRFQSYLLRLCLLAELFHDQLVLLGAAPTGIEHVRSWVMPGGIKSPSLWVGAGPNPLSMVTYYDRPSGDEAQRLFREGGLINTGICAVKVKTLWKLGWEILPDSMPRFDAFRQVLHGIKNDQVSPFEEEAALNHLYDRVSSADFSTDFLQRASDNITVLPMDDVAWSDWSSSVRLSEILNRAGALPWEAPAEMLPRQ